MGFNNKFTYLLVCLITIKYTAITGIFNNRKNTY